MDGDHGEMVGRVVRTRSSGESDRDGDCLQLIAAPPGEWCRHAAAHSSYFDRLWRTGVSKHSQREERFVLHVRRRAE